MARDGSTLSFPGAYQNDSDGPTPRPHLGAVLVQVSSPGTVAFLGAERSNKAPSPEQPSPFGAGWEYAIASLSAEDKPESRATIEWLETNRALLSEFDASGDSLLEMHQFHEAYHYQIGREEVLAEIDVAQKFRRERHAYCPETNSVPVPEQDDSIWAGRRFRHMLYINFLLKQKGHDDPPYNEETFNLYGDLADMVYPDMLFAGKYPKSGIIHQPPFEQGIHENTDWGHIDNLKQAYANTHLGFTAGNTAIRQRWTPEEAAAIRTEGIAIMEELREAYGAPEGLAELSIAQLKTLRERYGKAIKDADTRKSEMTLEYLDRRLQWIGNIFDKDTPPTVEASIVQDQIRTQLEQDLTLVVASALQSMRSGEFNHSEMIKLLVQARLAEKERAAAVEKKSKTYGDHVALAIKEVEAVESIALQRAISGRQETIAAQLSQQAMSHFLAA